MSQKSIIVRNYNKGLPNSSLIKYSFILLLFFFTYACKEENETQKFLVESQSSFISIHQSAFQGVHDPSKISLDTVSRPTNHILQFDGMGVGKSAAMLKHLFVDKFTGLPIPEDAQGKGLFSNFTTDQGLALDQVYCSYKDKQGNLWFGTNGGGVSKYNGKHFSNFTKLQGLASNVIWCMFEDKEGNMWFGTDGNGVSKYDGIKFTNFSKADGLANDVVLSIHQDRFRNMWFATLMGGVSKYDGKSFINYTKKQGLLNNNIRGIVEDKQGNMWFASYGGGIAKFNGKTFTNFTKDNGLSSDTLRCIYQDEDGNIWGGTENAGIFKYDGKKFTVFNKSQGLADNKVWTITEDTKGNIWIGTNGGASKLNAKGFTNYFTQQGLENNNVKCITEDNSGNIWVGTFGGGVSKFETRDISNFTNAQGLLNKVIYSITEDQKGNLWLATFGGGVCKYDRKSFTFYNTVQGLSSNLIYAIAKDKKGNFWLGTYGNGVIKFDGKSFTNYTTAQGLANNIVFCITEDKSGNLWFGTSGGGVSKFDGKSFTNYTTAQGLANNIIFCITEDKTGVLWFGTSGSGISRFDGKKFINFNNAHGLADNMVWAIKETKAGDIWVGTQQGLCLLTQQNISLIEGIKSIDTIIKKPLFKIFTNTDGLPDNFITQIIELDNKKLVIGTNDGICILKPDSIERNSEKKWHVGKIFNSKTGYPIKDVNAGTGAMFKDSKGILWIGTGSDKTGLVRFNPLVENEQTPSAPKVILESIKINQENLIWHQLAYAKNSVSVQSVNKDPIIIEETQSFGRGLNAAERKELYNKFKHIQFDSIQRWYPIPLQLILPYENNSISFDFNAIETGKNNLVQYQYFLEGYDNNWSPVSSISSASFGNMYEGKYTFKLRAKNPDGLWSQPLEYSFTVLPPWWRSWWMYTIYLFLSISIIILIFRLNHKRIIQQKKLLEQKIIVATQEIRTEKEKVEAQKVIVEETLNELEATQAQLIQSEKMASLGELTAGIAHEIQNPLNFVNNFSEVSNELLDEMNAELANGDIEEAQLIAKDVKQNLEKITYHGKRADAIVKGMLQHSRSGSGQKESTDINQLCDEYLRLAYHGLRAKDKSFNAILKTEFDSTIGMVNILPLDIGRAVLNIITNAFYAVADKAKQGIEGFEPKITVSSKKTGNQFEIKIADNGNGIPGKILDKIFQPFFTTKPTGKGTGLGLSLSYDIVKAHGGELKVETKEGEGSEFIIRLPI